MTDINEAFEVLSNPTRRLNYDQTYKNIYPPPQENLENEPTNEEVMIGIMRYVAEEAAKGKKRREIVHDLTKKGVPFDVSASIVNGVFQSRSTLKRKEGLKGIGCGLLMLIIGGIITAATYSAASEGGTYIVTTGLFIVGGITFLVGLFRWITS